MLLEEFMLFVIHALDHEGASETRLRHYDDHKWYLASSAVKSVVSGPLLAEDGETMIGSMFIVEAPDRAAAEAFNRSDPFHSAGIWRTVEIHRFSMRVDNRT